MNDYTYENVDLRTATVYDLAEVLKDCPAILISPIKKLNDEDRRILALYRYSGKYKLKELRDKLDTLYEKELASIFE